MIAQAPVGPLALDADAPATSGDFTSVEARNDATYGWEMFGAFSAAVVGISIAVCVLALIGSWVMLGVAIAAHLAVTATMMKLGLCAAAEA